MKHFDSCLKRLESSGNVDSTAAMLSLQPGARLDRPEPPLTHVKPRTMSTSSGTKYPLLLLVAAKTDEQFSVGTSP